MPPRMRLLYARCQTLYYDQMSRVRRASDHVRPMGEAEADDPVEHAVPDDWVASTKGKHGKPQAHNKIRKN